VSERKGLRARGRWRKMARDRGRRERQHVRPMSVESDETLLDSAPGISRGNGGLILRRKFLTSRAFEPGRREKRLKYYLRDGFPMPEVGAARDGGISRRTRARAISINLFGNASLSRTRPGGQGDSCPWISVPSAEFGSDRFDIRRPLLSSCVGIIIRAERRCRVYQKISDTFYKVRFLRDDERGFIHASRVSSRRRRRRRCDIIDRP